MTSKWETALLGDLCTLTKGKSPTLKTAPGQYPLIVTGPSPLSSIDYQFNGEAVCIPMVSSTGHGHASLKRVHFARGKFAVANIITACEVIDPQICDTKFLAIYLQHFKDELIVARMQGTANVSLSQRALSTIPISLPSLAEQSRIVDLIGALDDAIEVANETSGLSEATYEAGCHTLPTGQFLQGDYSYDLGTSGQLISKVTSGKTLPKDVTGQIRAFGSNGAVGWTNKANFEEGTVVLGRVGANCGSVNMPTADFWATDNTLCVQGAYGVPPRYLYHLLRGLRLNQHQSGSGQPLITQRVVKEQPIALLPETEMWAVAEILDGLEESHAASVAHAVSLRKLRGELLTSLLSGAHTIPESYDEVMTAVEEVRAVSMSV